MLLHKQEDIDHARLRAVVQVLVDKESGAEAFEDYMKIAFPYLEGRKKQKKEEVREQLLSWVKGGALKVTPQEDIKKRGRSRLKERVVARMASPKQQKLHADVVDKWKKRTSQ